MTRTGYLFLECSQSCCCGWQCISSPPLLCVCVCVCVCGYVPGKNVCSVCFCLCRCVRIYVPLCGMKWRRPACAGWGLVVRWENEQRLPLGLCLHYTAAGRSASSWGKVGEWEQSKCTHYLRCWEVKTPAVGCPGEVLVHNGKKQQRWEGARR